MGRRKEAKFIHGLSYRRKAARPRIPAKAETLMELADPVNSGVLVGYVLGAGDPVPTGADGIIYAGVVGVTVMTLVTVVGMQVE